MEHPKQVSRQFIKNLKRSSLKVMYAAKEYRVPAKGVYVDEWDVPEEEKDAIVRHALTIYASVREPTAAREKQKPAKRWLTLEHRTT